MPCSSQPSRWALRTRYASPADFMKNANVAYSNAMYLRTKKMKRRFEPSAPSSHLNLYLRSVSVPVFAVFLMRSPDSLAILSRSRLASLLLCFVGRFSSSCRDDSERNRSNDLPSPQARGRVSNDFFSGRLCPCGSSSPGPI